MERNDQRALVTGEDLLEAIITIATEQYEIRQLQDRRDRAAAKLHELIMPGQEGAEWPLVLEDVPEHTRSEAGLICLDYVLARDGALKAIQRYDYPGRLPNTFIGLGISISTKAGMEHAVKLPGVKNLIPTEPVVAATEVTGITARSPQIGSGLLRVIPEGTKNEVYAEIAMIDETFTPLVDVTIHSLPANR